MNAALQIGGGAQQVTPFAEQLMPGGGQACAMAAAIKQQNVQILLKLLNRIGNCRRHPVQFAGRAGERAFALDGIQYLQGVKRQSHIL